MTILLEALHLNNSGISIWNGDIGRSGGDEDAAISAFTCSLNAVQQYMRCLSRTEAEEFGGQTEAEVQSDLMFRPHSVSSLFSLTERTLGLSSQQRLFVFHKALEVTGIAAMDWANSDLGMNDAVVCSACIIFNMALAHHSRYLRSDNATDESKAEQLYQLTLQLLDTYPLAHSNSHRVTICLWVRLCTLNNVGILKASLMGGQQSSDEARTCFLELMNLLNSLELETRASLMDHGILHSLLDEMEWNGMTDNCLAILFDMPNAGKFAVSA
jgi:hypothetical protein